MHAALAIRGSPLFEVEHRSADGNRFAAKGELGELDCSTRLQHRNRAVRRSEIDAESTCLRSPEPIFTLFRIRLPSRKGASISVEMPTDRSELLLET